MGIDNTTPKGFTYGQAVKGFGANARAADVLALDAVVQGALATLAVRRKWGGTKVKDVAAIRADLAKAAKEMGNKKSNAYDWANVSIELAKDLNKADAVFLATLEKSTLDEATNLVKADLKRSHKVKSVYGLKVHLGMIKVKAEDTAEDDTAPSDAGNAEDVSNVLRLAAENVAVPENAQPFAITLPVENGIPVLAHVSDTVLAALFDAASAEISRRSELAMRVA